MKNYIMLMLCCLTFIHVRGVSNAASNYLEVSFYQTNLVCAAASDIGCGTRAKPILLEFMAHDASKEAFLNHAGTVIAVVWNEDVTNRHEVANHVFSSSNQPFLEITGEAREEQLSDFQRGVWYKGNEVDKLSIIEAGRMADQMTNWITDEPGFTKKDQKQVREAFRKYIEKSLLAIEDAAIINQTSYWRQWESDLTAIGRELVGDKMPQMQLVPASAGEECTPRQSCCKDKEGAACCKKTN